MSAGKPAERASGLANSSAYSRRRQLLANAAIAALRHEMAVIRGQNFVVVG